MRLLGNKILKFCECNRSKFARDWIVFGSEEGFDIFLSSHSERLGVDFCFRLSVSKAMTPVTQSGAKGSKPLVDARGCGRFRNYPEEGGRRDVCNNEATDSDPGEPNAGNLVQSCA